MSASMASSTTSLLLPSHRSEAARFRVAYDLETQRLQAQYHLDSVSESQGFITSFVQSRWDEHLWSSIKVTCDLTMVELRDIGRWSREEGVHICGNLVRAPVIHQEVAERLWEFLVACQGRGHGEEPDEQEAFEREVVAALADEEKRMAEDGEPGASPPTPCCVFCEGRTGQTCQLPPDLLLQRDQPSEGGRLDGVLWGREDIICPCQKTHELASEDVMASDDHGSETSAERREAGLSSPSLSTSPSTRSSLSQIFTWGRRS